MKTKKNEAYSIEIYGAYSVVIIYLCIDNDNDKWFLYCDVKTKIIE